MRGAKNVGSSASAAATSATTKTKLMALASARRTPALTTTTAPGSGSNKRDTKPGSRLPAFRLAASRTLNAAPMMLTPIVPPIERLNCTIEVAVPSSRRSTLDCTAMKYGGMAKPMPTPIMPTMTMMLTWLEAAPVRASSSEPTTRPLVPSMPNVR